MGRKNNRKRERRARQKAGDFAFAGSPFESRPPQVEVEDFIFLAPQDNSRTFAKTCGGCREFIEDAEGGRGTCLHPGSGILSPWTDTPACDFHMRRR